MVQLSSSESQRTSGNEISMQEEEEATTACYFRRFHFKSMATST
jgi:hypothetical protein